jgi:hypothetical protein
VIYCIRAAERVPYVTANESRSRSLFRSVKTQVQCFVGDLGLQRGILEFKAMTLETGESVTNVGGNVDLAKETIDLALMTDAKHFSVGSLPTRINISGTFKDPKIRPGAEVAAPAGAAAGLAALFAPLAILPTIQLAPRKPKTRVAASCCSRLGRAPVERRCRHPRKARQPGTEGTPSGSPPLQQANQRLTTTVGFRAEIGRAAQGR